MMSRIDRTVSPMYLSETYPLWLWRIISGSTFFDSNVAITLDNIFASTFRREIGRQFSMKQRSLPLRSLFIKCDVYSLRHQMLIYVSCMMSERIELGGAAPEKSPFSHVLRDQLC